MNSKNIDYYAIPTHITSVRGFESYIDEISDDINLIVQVVQGLFIHDGWLKIYNTEYKKENTPDTILLTVEDIFKRVVEIDDRSFLIPRGVEKRIEICCREFSLVFCAILRYKNIPCRVRVGFASYLAPPDLFEDHWICEYWDMKNDKWIRIDPQIDLFQHMTIRKWTDHYENQQYRKMIYSFDNFNLRAIDFYLAGTVWNQVNGGKADEKKYGLYNEPDSFGPGIIKANLLRDFACLNKEEPRVNFVRTNEFWGKWQLSNKQVDELTSNEMNLLNTIADFADEKEIDVEKITDFYCRNELVQVPRLDS